MHWASWKRPGPAPSTPNSRTIFANAGGGGVTDREGLVAEGAAVGFVDAGTLSRTIGGDMGLLAEFQITRVRTNTPIKAASATARAIATGDLDDGRAKAGRVLSADAQDAP